MPKRLAAPRARVMTRFDALSLRCLSASEGSAERQVAASGLSEGSLSALRARRYIEPLPLAYRLFRGTPIAPGRDGPGLSNPGGGQTSS